MTVTVTDRISADSAEAQPIVTLTEFKQHLRWPADDNTENVLMQAYITAATEQAQQFTGRQFSVITWEALVDRFYYQVTLPKSPVDVDSIEVQYYDTENELQTLDPAEYKVIDGGEYGFTIIKFDGDMPNLYDKPQAVIISYDAGYETVPGAVKVAVMLQAASYFENRQNEVTGTTPNTITFGSQQLLFPFKTFYNNSCR